MSMLRLFFAGAKGSMKEWRYFQSKDLHQQYTEGNLILGG